MRIDTGQVPNTDFIDVLWLSLNLTNISYWQNVSFPMCYIPMDAEKNA